MPRVSATDTCRVEELCCSNLGPPDADQWPVLIMQLVGVENWSGAVSRSLLGEVLNLRGYLGRWYTLNLSAGYSSAVCSQDHIANVRLVV